MKIKHFRRQSLTNGRNGADEGIQRNPGGEILPHLELTHDLGHRLCPQPQLPTGRIITAQATAPETLSRGTEDHTFTTALRSGRVNQHQTEELTHKIP